MIVQTDYVLKVELIKAQSSVLKSIPHPYSWYTITITSLATSPVFSIEKMTHLMFVDDLKVYVKGLDLCMESVENTSKALGMALGLQQEEQPMAEMYKKSILITSIFSRMILNYPGGSQECTKTFLSARRQAQLTVGGMGCRFSLVLLFSLISCSASCLRLYTLFTISNHCASLSLHSQISNYWSSLL